MREVFELYDRNGDKTITIADLGTVMRALGQNISERELRAIIAEIDADGERKFYNYTNLYCLFVCFCLFLVVVFYCFGGLFVCMTMWV